MLRSRTLRALAGSLGLPAFLLSAFLIVDSSAVAADPRPMIDADVRRGVVRGPVRVLVDLHVTDGTPSAIASAQHDVVARLAGTRFTAGRQYSTVPMMALEIAADALDALEKMGDLVRRVRPDLPRPPAPGSGS